MSRTRAFAAPLALLAAAVLTISQLPAKEPAAEAKQPTASKQADDVAQPAPQRPRKIKPKPLSEQTRKGLEYLAGQQHASGGWGQGGGWRQANSGRIEGEEVADPPDMGNTCVAALALIRSGSTPSKGRYADHLAKAFDYICTQIEEADDDSPYVTYVRDTQLQTKIGQYVDTFLAALVLTEMKGTLADKKSERRLTAALKKTIKKIEKNQQQDGNFAGNQGWASVLSLGLCSKALNRAAQFGVEVSQDALARDFAGNTAGLDVARGEFAGAGGMAGGSSVSSVSDPVPASVAGDASPVELSRIVTTAPVAATAAPSDAGVQLYNFSAKAGGLQEASNTNAAMRNKARSVLADDRASSEQKDEATRELERLNEQAAQQRQAQGAAVDGLMARLDDEQFIAGFGNNGGEEFLSHMNISETLLAAGGEEFERWDRAISAAIGTAQNEDGSWSGHHCITGRTFCTASALLTLMADRAPVPLAGAIDHAR